MTRDQRLQARTLHAVGWQATAIQKFFKDRGEKLTYRQVYYACKTRPTPKKRTGRPPIISTTQIEELIAFISLSKINRRMAYWRVATELGWEGVSESAIRSALRRVGYRRYVALHKPPISEKNRQLRLEFALQHKDWTDEQWDAILWSDETWVTPGSHRKTYVTRKADEALNPTCIVEKERKKKGWMFWGCFSGKAGKGPGIFWEKDWGTINAESYQQYTVPVIHGWMRLHPGHIFMQDGAPGHAADETLQDLLDRGIVKVEWPPYSPDLNPIETVWNWMKDYIKDNYPQDKMRYDELRKAVKEAWNAVPEEWLIELVRGMKQRCEAVIKANGMYTKY
jgi:hypothetical protein